MEQMIAHWGRRATEAQMELLNKYSQLKTANERAERAEADCAALREALELIANSGKEEKFNWCIKHKCHLGAANDSPILLIYRIAKQALSSPHPGAELLERAKVLERALEIACKYTACPYIDSMGSALPCDNNDLNCPQCFIAQAKEGRP